MMADDEGVGMMELMTAPAWVDKRVTLGAIDLDTLRKIVGGYDD